MTIETHRLPESLTQSQQGFSLLEVMMAMVILAFAMLGVMGMFQWGEYGVRRGAMEARALEMVQARIEAKRTQSWLSLLTDDLNLDGNPEFMMHDDGLQEDVTAGDGIFTASLEQDGIQLTWTVQPNRHGTLGNSTMAVIQANARYRMGDDRWRDIRIGTLRANPNYIGSY